MTAATREIPRRCADCRREFERPQEYMGSPRGVVCRNRRACAAAAPRHANGRLRPGGIARFRCEPCDVFTICRMHCDFSRGNS